MYSPAVVRYIPTTDSGGLGLTVNYPTNPIRTLRFFLVNPNVAHSLGGEIRDRYLACDDDSGAGSGPICGRLETAQTERSYINPGLQSRV